MKVNFSKRFKSVRIEGAHVALIGDSVTNEAKGPWGRANVYADDVRMVGNSVEFVGVVIEGRADASEDIEALAADLLLAAAA